MRDVKPEVINFSGDKPWEDEADWEGVRRWKEATESMVRVSPKMSDLFITRSLSSSQRSQDEVMSSDSSRVTFRTPLERPELTLKLNGLRS